MSGKKENEKKCYEMVLKCRTSKGKFASSMHQVLISKKNFVDYGGERPDIIINADTEVIGIEHCLTDVLFDVGAKRGKAQSMIRRQSGNSERLLRKYQDRELLDADIKNGTAIKSILTMAEERSERQLKFSYADFISNFREVCREHNDNCQEYRKRISDIAAGRVSTLACLIEIPYLKESVYRVNDSKGTRRQAINGIPITEDMLLAVQNMRGFDFVILCMYCLDDPLNINGIVCYYFLPRAIKEGIKQQRIKPVWSFGLTRTFEVKFPEDEISINDNGDVTFMARVIRKGE